MRQAYPRAATGPRRSRRSLRHRLCAHAARRRARTSAKARWIFCANTPSPWCSGYQLELAPPPPELPPPEEPEEDEPLELLDDEEDDDDDDDEDEDEDDFRLA